MPIELNMNNITMSLFNAETGENLGELDGIQEVKMDVNTKYETKYDKENHKFNSLISCSNYEMTFGCATTDLNMDALLGIDKATKPDVYDIKYIKIVPCRTHKKKRINKKWEKRYGYRQINVTSKGWMLKTYEDGTFEFKKDI